MMQTLGMWGLGSMCFAAIWATGAAQSQTVQVVGALVAATAMALLAHLAGAL